MTPKLPEIMWTPNEHADTANRRRKDLHALDCLIAFLVGLLAALVYCGVIA
jgi:hypothetical protein